MDARDHTPSPLATHSQRLRERTEAVCRFSGGVPTFEEGIKVFCDYCDKHGMWLTDPTGVLRTEPDAHGDEHEVWFVGDTVIKLAYPDFFGLRVVYRSDEDNRSLPHEYLERWDLHNRLFGDDVIVPGALRTTDGLRMVLIQKAIMGAPTAPEKIETFFRDNQWLPFRTNDGRAWFDKERSLVVSDTHQGNLIETADGSLVPIDFRIQALSGSLLDAVKRLV